MRKMQLKHSREKRALSFWYLPWNAFFRGFFYRNPHWLVSDLNKIHHSTDQEEVCHIASFIKTLNISKQRWMDRSHRTPTSRACGCLLRTIEIGGGDNHPKCDRVDLKTQKKRWPISKTFPAISPFSFSFLFLFFSKNRNTFLLRPFFLPPWQTHTETTTGHHHDGKFMQHNVTEENKNKQTPHIKNTHKW